MQQNKFNPALRAVMSIRHLVTGLKTNWKQMEQIGDDLESMIKDARSLMSKQATPERLMEWQGHLDTFNGHVMALKEILAAVVEKINQRDVRNIGSTWQQTSHYMELNRVIVKELELSALRSFPEDQKDNWRDLWSGIRIKISLLENFAEACNLQLSMIEKYKPEEMDEMTDIILRQIPKGYSLAEADEYEKDYLMAYEHIKNEAQGKKNLWDKFLDILAAGTQGSPAERLRMERWLEGEKGDL